MNGYEGIQQRDKHSSNLAKTEMIVGLEMSHASVKTKGDGSYMMVYKGFKNWKSKPNRNDTKIKYIV